METIVIVTLGVMLIIALLQLRSKNFDNEVLTNKLNAEEKANKSNVKKQVVLLNQIEKLKYNAELKEKALKKAKESDCEYSNSKFIELETKYKRALVKIVERDEVIRLRDSQILKYDKSNKELAEELKKRNKIMEDAWNVVRQSEKEKDIAIKETKSALKLCKESVATVAHLRAELDSIELLLSK